MLQKVKDYLRISHNVDDNYIQSLIDLSKDFIKAKTGVEYSRDDSIYTQAIYMCVAHYYDNRTSIVEKAIQEVPYTLNELIKTIGFRKNEVKQSD